MVSFLLVHLQQGIALFLVALLLIALSNCWGLRRLSGYRSEAPTPLVSILLPARNEALNIAACVRSLLAQDYPNFEVWVLDDNSTDNTASIVQALAAEEPRLHLLKGQPLPPGWLGKHWACHQLTQAATGKLWLFTDADTVHQPQALRQAVAALNTHKADLVSALPRQIMGSWGERFIVSILPWSIFSFYPFWLAHRLGWPPLVTAIGQFLLFRREAYQGTGGHAAIRTQVADDIVLAQRLVAQGGLWRLLDAGELVTCRMYQNFGEAYAGFSKNLFAAFGYNTLAFVAIWLWLAVVFLAPLLLILLWAVGLIAVPTLSLVAVGLAVCLWVLCCWRLHLPLALAVMYPVTIVMAVILAVRSVVLTRSGQATWKGRTVARPGP